MPSALALLKSYWMKHFKLNQPAFSKKQILTNEVNRISEEKYDIWNKLYLFVNFELMRLFVQKLHKGLWSFPREWKAWSLTCYKTYKNTLIIFKDRTSTFTTSGKKTLEILIRAERVSLRKSQTSTYKGKCIRDPWNYWKVICLKGPQSSDLVVSQSSWSLYFVILPDMWFLLQFRECERNSSSELGFIREIKFKQE